MIKGLNISKKYKKFELQPTSIEIDKGEIVALIGENGAGKSTLIKCMCGVIDADEGQLEVDDQVVKFGLTNMKYLMELMTMAMVISSGAVGWLPVFLRTGFI